jgi:hypothetical protein
MDQQVIKEMSAMEVLFQLGGFGSSALERKYAERGYMKQAEAAITKTHNTLVNREAHAKLNKEDDTEIKAGIQRWNAKHPDWRITGDNIDKSKRGIKKHEKDRAGRGYEVSPKLSYLYEKYDLGLDED